MGNSAEICSWDVSGRLCRAIFRRSDVDFPGFLRGLVYIYIYIYVHMYTQETPGPENLGKPLFSTLKIDF